MSQNQQRLSRHMKSNDLIDEESKKFAPISSLVMDYSAGGNIPDILESMWKTKIETRASEVRANLNGVSVIMIDEHMFKILKTIVFK